MALCFLLFKWFGPFQGDPVMGWRKSGRSSLGDEDGCSLVQESSPLKDKKSKEVGRGGGEESQFLFFFFVATKAPAVRCGRYDAPSGSLLGGNSNAFTQGAERESNIVK